MAFVICVYKQSFYYNPIYFDKIQLFVSQEYITITLITLKKSTFPFHMLGHKKKKENHTFKNIDIVIFNFIFSKIKFIRNIIQVSIIYYVFLIGINRRRRKIRTLICAI